MPVFSKNTAGFSLIWVSMLIAVAGIMMVAAIPGGGLGNDADKKAITLERMQKIEEATKAFMLKNYRRPCPSTVFLALTDTNFGVEAVNTTGFCTGSVPSATFTDGLSVASSTVTAGSAVVTLGSAPGTVPVAGENVSGTGILPGTRIVSYASGSRQITMDTQATTTGTVTVTFNGVSTGGVPVKTLGLPDEYAMDGYGHRLMYMLDTQAASTSTCQDAQHTGQAGAIKIFGIADATVPDDYVMWALLSYGKDAHGAYSEQGGSNTRTNAYITSGDTEANAFVDATFTTVYSNALYRHEPTYGGSNGFDDIVWYLDSTKNTCCIGKQCEFATTAKMASGYYKINGIATGDINGDGIQDLVISVNDGAANAKTYVIFGKRKGWPFTNSFIDATALDGTNGFVIISTINASGLYSNVAVGDVNGDGYDDIVFPYDTLSGFPLAAGYAVVFGAASFAATGGTITASTLTGTAGANPHGSLISFPAILRNPSVAIGNVTNHAPGDNSKDIVYTGPVSLGSASVYIISGNTGAWSSPVTNTYAIGGGGLTGYGLAVGDLNNDGIDDITFQGKGNSNNTTYVEFGRSSWSASLNTDITAGSATALSFTAGVSYGATSSAVATIADVDGDGIKDLIIPGAGQTSIYPGGAGFNASPTAGVITNTNLKYTAGGTLPIKVADLNNDGRKDLIFGGTSPKVYFQPAGGITSTSNWNLNGNDGFAVTDSATPFTTPSYFPVVADINGDGIPDLIFVASGTAAGSVPRVYIIYGRANVPWEASVDLKNTP